MIPWPKWASKKRARSSAGKAKRKLAGSDIAIRSLLALTVLVGAGSIVGSVLSWEKRIAYRYENASPVESPEFLRSMGTFGTAMVPGNKVELLQNGDEIFGSLLAAIREARSSITLELYIFSNDSIGRKFADALMEAERRGVQARVLVDGAGSRLRDLKEEMRKAGVDVQVYRPMRPWTVHRLGRRLHRKVMVVDGRVCFTGGFGFDEHWQGDARSPEEWRETAVRVTGPVAAQMQAIFGEDWTFTTGEILGGEELFPQIAPAGEVPAQAISVSRGDASSRAKMLFYIAIESARRSIRLQNAYFVPDGQLRKSLAHAARRGVDVRIMVPGKHTDRRSVRAASRGIYNELLESGVRLYEYDKTMIHTKMAVVDGIFSTIGSINFVERSMKYNAEESLAFYDRGVAAELERMFDRDVTDSREITLEEWKKRGLHQRVFEKVASLFNRAQ